MIRVLHAIDTNGPGGAEMVFTSLVKRIDTEKFLSVVVINGPGWVADEIIKNGRTPIFVGSSGAFNLTYLWKLIKIIREHKIDIVHSHLWGSNVYTSMAGIICRVKVISTFHGFVDIGSNESLSFLKRIIVNAGSTKTVFVSDRLRAYFVKVIRLSATNAMTIYNGVDTKKFYPSKNSHIRKQLSIHENSILIGAVGNIREAKGYDILIAAARRVVDSNPRVHFVVAGEGFGDYYETLIAQRDSLGLKDHFHFIGFVSETSEFINNLDLFVLSSISEGFSISTIEAMACGVPVVVTYSGGPEEIVEDGETGIMVSPGDSTALATALLKCAESTPARVVDMALERCRNKFSIEKMVSSYEKCYQETYEKA